MSTEPTDLPTPEPAASRPWLFSRRVRAAARCAELAAYSILARRTEDADDLLGAAAKGQLTEEDFRAALRAAGYDDIAISRELDVLANGRLAAEEDR